MSIGVDVEFCATAGTVEEAGEEPGGVTATPAGVVLPPTGEVFFGFPFGEDGLGDVPGGVVNDGVAVVFDDEVCVVEGAFVDGVAEKIGEGGVGFEEAGLGEDLAGGGTAEEELIGVLDGGGEGGVGVPAVGGVGFSVAVMGDEDGGALETPGGRAGDASVFEDELTEATLDIDAEVFEVALVHPVDGALEKTSFRAGGELVLKGVDFVSPAAQIRFVKLGVVYVAGEAGKLPDDQPGYREAIPKCVHHFVELVTPGGGFGCDAIPIDAVDGVAVFDGPFAAFGFLLGDGEFLIFVTGVAKVENEGGTSGKGEHLLSFGGRFEEVVNEACGGGEEDEDTDNFERGEEEEGPDEGGGEGGGVGDGAGVARVFVHGSFFCFA